MINYRILLLIVIAFVGCKPRIPRENASLKKIENFVRYHYDKKANHSYQQYEEILKILDSNKFTTLPIHLFKDSIDQSKVMVSLRHDVDNHPFKALKMATMEKKHGILASYYILSTARYYGKYNGEDVFRYPPIDVVYTTLHEMGHEIGIHNDMMALMINHDIDPFNFTRQEIKYFENLGIPIYGSVAHGSSIASNTVRNFEVFSDYAKSDSVAYKGKSYPIGQHSMSDYGFTYEANFINHKTYFSESGGKWSNEGGYEAFIHYLKNAKPGDRIQVLTHPTWWGK